MKILLDTHADCIKVAKLLKQNGYRNIRFDIDDNFKFVVEYTELESIKLIL